MKLFKRLMTGLASLMLLAGVSGCGGIIGSIFNEQKAAFYEEPLTVLHEEAHDEYAVDLCFAWNAAGDIASKFEAKAKHLFIKIEGKDSELTLDRINVSLKAEDGVDGKYVDEKYRSAIEILPFAEKDLKDERLNHYITDKELGDKYTTDSKRALKARINLTKLAEIADIEKLFNCEIFTMKFDLSNGIVSTIDSDATLKWEYHYDKTAKAFSNNTHLERLDVKGCKDTVIVGETYTVGTELRVSLIFNQGPAKELAPGDYEVRIDVDTSAVGEGRVTFIYPGLEPVVITVLVMEALPTA